MLGSQTAMKFSPLRHLASKLAPGPGTGPGEASMNGGSFRCELIGQRQKWFAMRFTGREAEIDIAPRGGHKAEFDAWRWAAVSELAGLIVPFKRQVYADVVREFARYVG